MNGQTRLWIMLAILHGVLCSVENVSFWVIGDKVEGY